MELYYIGLQQAENEMKRQFEYASKPQPERPEPQPEHTTVTERARLAVGAALYRLANAIDPATPVPSRQH